MRRYFRPAFSFMGGDNAFAALKVAHKAYVLEVGAVGLSGTGAELLNDPKVRAAYLGG